jgi:poly-gamma-glutamate synthesis protein (capsule biosynthesis protein)
MLGGDVMLGRGIDQILPYPGDPTLYESWRNVFSAKLFVQLAARKNGALPTARGIDYVWGDALRDFEHFAPDLRLANLETAITMRGRPKAKRLHYRMHPRNIGVLVHAGIDFCSLANNHVLDWGAEGLEDTIDTLDRAGIAHAGAGRDGREAATPAILPVPGTGRVLVLSFATASSGVPADWAPGEGRVGVNLIALSDDGFGRVRRSIAEAR